MAQGKVGSLYFTLGVNASDFEKKLNMATAKIADFGEKAKRIGQSMSLFITTPIVAAGTAALKMASDYDESLNKVDVAFKDASGTVRAFADTTLKSFGIAEGTALDMAALFGDMATSMGISTGEAANLSTSMVGLAGDLASFKNMNIKEVTTALNGVFTGETESLKRLGVVMTEVNLEQFAMNQGITKTIQEMTQAEKVLLRYQYVMSVTANAHGDFERTGGGAANQMRVFTEGLKELAVQFGQVVLPAFTSAIKVVNGWMDSLMAMNEGQKTFIITVGLAVAAIGPFLYILGSIATLLPTLISGFLLLNRVLLSNPIVLVVVGMIALVDTIDKVVAATKKEVDVVKRAIEVNTKFAETLGTITDQYSQYLTAKQNSATYSKKEADAIIENIKAKKAEVTANRELLEGLRAVENARIKTLEKQAGNKGNISIQELEELKERRAAVKEMTATIEASRRSEIEMGAAIAEVTKAIDVSTDAFKAFNPAGKTVGEIEMRIDALSTALKDMIPHSKEYNAAMAEISRLKLTIDTSGVVENKKAFQELNEVVDLSAGKMAAFQASINSLSKTDNLTPFLNTVTEEFKRLDQIAGALGTKSEDLASQKLSLIENQIISMINAGKMGTKEFQELLEMYNQLKAPEGLEGFEDSLESTKEKAAIMANAVSQAFDIMSQNLLGSLLNSENGFDRFIGGLAQTVLKLISMFLSQALAAAIAGSQLSAAATGPAAIVTSPAFLATMVGGVLGAFAAIPKFATGGAVTGPTLAMVGENPASRGEAIIPFERMGSFLQQFGMGTNGNQHITISGQLAGDTIRLSGQSATNKIESVRWGRNGGINGRALVN